MTTPTTDIRTQVTLVVDALSRGHLVIFLGAGANLCDRPDGWAWDKNQRNQLPTGGELSQHLSNTFRVHDSGDLARVAQNIALTVGTGPLYDELRGLLAADYPLTRLHRLLASLPARLRAAGYPRTTDRLFRQLLFISTNYDTLLERALVAAGEQFHMLVYEADGPRKGKFLYQSPDGEEVAIERRMQFTEIVADEHPILMKFHGGLHPTNRHRDSFVITEDHYIEYLARTASTPLIPAPVPALLEESHVLFLGHALRDWNLRVVLYQLWQERKLTWKSWAIQREPDQMDYDFWKAKGVDILDCALDEYVTMLDERLKNLDRTMEARR